MHRIGTRSLTGSLIAGALVLAGCVPAESPAGEEPDAKPTELRLAIGGEPDDGFDPTLGWGRYGSPMFQSTLVKLDAELNVVHDLATGYEVSDDALTWTVTIRDDATFHDGQPVTASDVAYTYEATAASGGLADVQMLEAVTAVDETTVVFSLREPRSNFVYQMSTLGIVPEHAHDGSYSTRPIGSGPFKFVQWDAGQQLIVERNDDYYGEVPHFQRIVFMFTEEDGRVAAARAGQINLAGVGSTFATAEIDGFDVVAVPSLDNRGVSLPFGPDDGAMTASGAPVGNDVTSDLAIRRALNYAVDRDALVEGVLEGYGSPAQGPADAAPWFEPDSAIQGNDPDHAAQILADGGWSPGGDGVLEKDGVRAEFSILYGAGDPVRQGLAIAMADQVRPLGINITAEGTTWDEIGRRMHSEGVMFGFGSHDPIETFYLYGTEMGGIDYFNAGFYSNPIVDEHFRTALTALDPDEALTAWRAAQLDEDGNGYSAQADAAWVWLVNLDHTYYVDDCLDLGPLQIEPHGHGWPITAGITGWEWVC